MKKFAVAAVALMALSSSAMAGERLTTTQLDQVTAGLNIAVALAEQSNFNFTKQKAEAESFAIGGCAFGCKFSGNASSSAVAANQNWTSQGNSNAAVVVD